jgi:hypothetical protein
MGRAEAFLTLPCPRSAVMAVRVRRELAASRHRPSVNLGTIQSVEDPN